MPADSSVLGINIFFSAILWASVAALGSIPEVGVWVLLRWFAGGAAILAVAEMATAAIPLMGAAVGVDIPGVFRSPWQARSLNEFWTKRWNIPASEMFCRVVFSPIARSNLQIALLATFAVSGLAHLLLTYVALGRWGVSLLCGSFFIAQVVMIQIERQLNVRSWPGMAKRAWTFAALGFTAPLIIEPVLQILQLGPGQPVDALLAAAGVLAFVIAFSGLFAIASLATLPPRSEPSAIFLGD